ncbi:hypothetical protein [Phenylobacterium sp.]|jgi:hypothetical protein|uniref:hypothetical protein n=1 Tax=Phenylobacterium sp. TaxID=1871053 RepID=UPI002F94E3B5
MAATFLVLAAVMAAEPAAAGKLEWLSRPRARDIAECIPGVLPRGDHAIQLHCVTAPGDRLENCRVEAATGKVHPKVERAALCSAKYFRMRATDRDGQVVLGAPASVPLNFSRP